LDVCFAKSCGVTRRWVTSLFIVLPILAPPPIRISWMAVCVALGKVPLRAMTQPSRGIVEWTWPAEFFVGVFAGRQGAGAGVAAGSGIAGAAAAAAVLLVTRAIAGNFNWTGGQLSVLANRESSRSWTMDGHTHGCCFSWDCGRKRGVW